MPGATAVSLPEVVGSVGNVPALLSTGAAAFVAVVPAVPAGAVLSSPTVLTFADGTLP